MSTLPEAAIGEEMTVPPGPPARWARIRALVGAKLSYALADQVAYSFGNLVVLALINRHCTSWQFGIYILTQRAMDVLIQVCNVLLWSPYMFHWPGKTPERRKLFLGSIVAQQLFGCIVAALVLLAASWWASTPARGMYYGVFAPLILSSIGILFREFTRRHYFAHMRFAEAMWTDVATVALQIGGVEWLYVTHRLNVPNTLWMLSISAVIVSFWWVAREWRTFAVSLRANLEDLRDNVRLGRWLLASNMIYVVSAQCNPWILGTILGPAAVGAYTICENMVNIPRVALTSMQNTMAPTMARGFADGGKPTLRKIVKRFDRTLLLGSVLFSIGIYAFGPWVARVIFVKSIPDHARTIMLLLALNFIAFAATMAQSYGLTVVGGVSKTVYANVAGLVVQLGMAVWLIHAIRVPGAAMAMLIGSAVVLVVRQYYYTQEMARP